MDFSFEYTYDSQYFPEQPKELHEKIATTGTQHEKWHLAGRDDLSPEVIAILAQDSDPSIRESIASNHLTPTNILASLASQHPDQIPPASIQENAPATLKELAPIHWQTDGSIYQYLKDKEATEDESTLLRKQRDRLNRQHLNRLKKTQKGLSPDEWPDIDTPRTPLLGEVWRSIHPDDEPSSPYSQEFLQAAAYHWDRWSRSVGSNREA
jgi:hypothetical protein